MAKADNFDLSGLDASANVQVGVGAQPTAGSITVEAPQPTITIENNQITISDDTTASASSGAGSSSAATGDYYHTSNYTGQGSQGMGGLTTSLTGNQSKVSLQTGTMGLAPVFGYGSGAQQSPGGYVGGSLLPSTIALPGGGAIGLPQINGNTIGNFLNGN
jgi:hypothetical protein